MSEPADPAAPGDAVPDGTSGVPDDAFAGATGAVFNFPAGHDFDIVPVDPGGWAPAVTAVPEGWVEIWEYLPEDDQASSGAPGGSYIEQGDYHADKVAFLAWIQRYKNTVSSWEIAAVNELREAAEAVIGDRHASPVTSIDASTGTSTRVLGRSGGWSHDVVVRRQLQAEVAAILRVSNSTAEKLVDAAQMLTGELPETFHALEVGVITLEHAVIIATTGREVPEERRGEYDTAVIPVARRGTLTDTRRKAREVREIMHPVSLLERHKTALECRDVRLEPAKDGMAYLTAYMPAVKAVGIYNRLTETGRHLQGPTETRTLTQLRLDVLTDLLITGSTSIDTNSATGHSALNGTITATVFLTMPALTLLDKSTQPATLEGYGPIDMDTARQLAGDSPSWIRVLTDPFTGAMLGVGRKRKIPQEMKDFLRLRDQHCRFPGCMRAAASCEIDHTTEYQYGGNTELVNLAHACKAHHGLKTYTGWDTSNADPATLIWRSATDHDYPSTAENPIGFVPTDTLSPDRPPRIYPGRDDGWDAERSNDREQDRYPGPSDSDHAHKHHTVAPQPDYPNDPGEWAQPRDDDEPFPF
jgi:hypothetical protein